MRTITNTQVLLVAMAVASMDHRGIDTVLKDLRQHPVAVVSTVLVIVFVGIRLLLHGRHEEEGKSRCRDRYRSILRGIVMLMRAHTPTRANCAHKHTGVAGCHGRGVYGSLRH